MKKLFVRVLAVVALTIAAAMQTTAQQSFSYQAVIRNAEGELVTNQKVGLKFSLLNGGKAYYTETQATDVNEYGNISVEIGKGTQVGDGKFSDVPWNTLDVTLRVEVDPTGGKNYQLLGETKISPAPYAMYATQGGGGAIANGASKDNGNLFEVTDREGRPVFAVTNDGIVVYVDDTDPDSDKARRSGFVVTGRTATKNGEGDLFAVTAEGAQVYVDEQTNDKARRSGFIVTGRTATKSSDGDLFAVNTEGTQVYVDGQADDKARRSGFIVTGRTATKDDADIFAVDGAMTTVYVDDSDDNQDKARRSGFIVTGRTATKDGNIVDINDSRTNLTTATLSIAGASANDEDAPVSALQITEEAVTMNSAMTMEGGVRPVLDVDNNEEYNIYISDNYEDDPDDYDGVYVDGDFYFEPSEVMEGSYYWLASFHDTLVVPLASQYGFLMLDSNGEETAIPQDAYVAVSYESSYYGSYINVWPLRELKDFKVSFALTDYYKSPGEIYGGNGGKEYARFNVTINSKAAYPSCRLRLEGQRVFTAMVKTSQGTFNVETGGNNYKEYQTVFGETVTLAVTKVPDGQVFDSWRCNGRRYTDSVLSLPIAQVENEIYPVFKDKSPVLFVDGVDGSENPTQPGDAFKTVAGALASIADSTGATLRGFRIVVENALNEGITIPEGFENLAKHITIDIHSYGSGLGNSLKNTKIDVKGSVPVIIRNAEVMPENGQEYAVYVDNGARLTLENCKLGKTGNQDENIRGAYVKSGELVLINTKITGFKAENGGGAYVASGATLSLKDESEICSNKAAEKGYGVYLCAGATLNVNNSRIIGNVITGNDWVSGQDVYAAGECGFNVSGQSFIGMVGLGDGAYVTQNIEGDLEKSVIELSTIENPNKKVAEIVGDLPEWMQDEMMDGGEMFYSQFFEITDSDLLAQDYSKYLKFDGNVGKPFKTKKVYSTGTISFMCSEEGQEEEQIYVYYTYYRGDDDEEYLRLKYNWDDSDYECHDYWLLGDKVYCDTIQAIYGLPNAIANADDLNGVFGTGYSWPAAWNDYGFDRTDDFKNLLTVNTTGYTLDAEGSIIGSENKPIASLNKDILANCTSKDLFSSILPGFRSLIQRSICFEGRNFSLSNAQIDQWSAGDFYYGDDVNSEIETHDEDFSMYNPWEIEEHFNTLRKGFDVTIMALGGTVTDENDNSYSGIVHLKNVAYNTKLTLSVDEDDQNFNGWVDGNEDRTRDFFIRGDVEIFPLFKQIDFTVSPNGPYKSFELVNKIIENTCGEGDSVKIHILGTVKGSQTFSSNILVDSIIIDGADYANPDNPNGVLDARKRGRVLTINTTSPVIIRNLTITGGNANAEDYDLDDDNNFGGGIMMTEGTKVTLEAGAVVGKVATEKASPNKYANFASIRGGGIYNEGGTLKLKSGSMVSYNYVKPQFYGDEQAIQGGGGIYSLGGEVIVESGASVVYNYSETRGGGIHLDAGAKLTSSGNIDYNVADAFGGGVMFATYDENETNTEVLNLYGSTTFTMEGGSVSHNETTYLDDYYYHSRGGGIFIDGGGTVTIKTGSVINNNSAAYEGGAIDITIGTLDLQGGTIASNSIKSTESDKYKGGAIRMSNNTTFKISGDAYIPCTGVSKNDVYLDNGAKITIANELSCDYVATITLENYAATTQVLQAIEGVTLSDYTGKFTLTPASFIPGGLAQWSINDQGFLAQNGAKYLFSISEETQVYFSQGNLQYRASTGTWRFAENQYDYVGDETNGNVYEYGERCDNCQINNDDYEGWIDLFGWGTGNNPTLFSTDNNNYGNFTEWGTNPIVNGGNAANTWRTLTDAEWTYLLSRTSDGISKCGAARIGTADNGVKGLVILPDNWTLPDGCSIITTDNKFFNEYSIEDWAKMEAAGAVFLPMGGNRRSNDAGVANGEGYYWSSSYRTTTIGLGISFSSGYVSKGFGIDRKLGCSVRLVKVAQQ